MGSQSFTTPGNFSFKPSDYGCPSGDVTIECLSFGGTGDIALDGGPGGVGGGGSAYAKSNISLDANTTYSGHVSTDSSDASWFSSDGITHDVEADPGNDGFDGGAGGLASASSGDEKYDGGDGGAGGSTGGSGGGGGGGGASGGLASAGDNGTAGSGTSGGAGAASYAGNGFGGDGGNDETDGADGTGYGNGGGGAGGGLTTAGGDGSGGVVIFTWDSVGPSTPRGKARGQFMVFFPT